VSGFAKSPLEPDPDADESVMEPRRCELSPYVPGEQPRMQLAKLKH